MASITGEPTTRESSVLDEIDARPGSTTSVLRTFVGLYLRRLGGTIAIADLVRLMEDFGIPAARTRTGVVRLKKKGLLLHDREGSIGYRLNPDSVPMLERGDRRIFQARRMQDDDPWCLISFSIPESQRDLRHQLRRRLQWIGCGVVAPALWICPDYLSDEVEQILDDLGVRAHATLFRSETPRVAGELRDAVNSWWELESLRVEHETFAAAADAIEATPIASDLDGFVGYMRVIDSWRVLPYVDPGLPSSLVPDHWPGQASVDRFNELSGRLAAPAWAHVRSVTGA